MYEKNVRRIIARPIKETPILYGEDAWRFSYVVEHPRKASSDEKQPIEEDCQLMMSIAKCTFKNDRHFFFIDSSVNNGYDAYIGATIFYEKNEFGYFTTLDVFDKTHLMYFDLKDIKEQL